MIQNGPFYILLGRRTINAGGSLIRKVNGATEHVEGARRQKTKVLMQRQGQGGRLRGGEDAGGMRGTLQARRRGGSGGAKAAGAQGKGEQRRGRRAGVGTTAESGGGATHEGRHQAAPCHLETLSADSAETPGCSSSSFSY